MKFYKISIHTQLYPLQGKSGNGVGMTLTLWLMLILTLGICQNNGDDDGDDDDDDDDDDDNGLKTITTTRSGNERLPKRASVVLVVYSHDAGWIPNFNAKLCQTVSHNAAKCLRATESATLNVTAKETFAQRWEPAFTLPNQQHVAFDAHGGFRHCHIKQQLPIQAHPALFPSSTDAQHGLFIFSAYAYAIAWCLEMNRHVGTRFT
uniref:Uncharacterized protein n=1 Tax=Glossina austeni TaxID=7395 RepID=A0A1A9UGC6_GLOAU